MLDLQIIARGRAVPIFDLPATLGRSDAVREISDTIDALIAFMDNLDGDPDLEETDVEDSFAVSAEALASSVGPGCPIGDPGGGNIDDEPHDPEEDCCLAGDDMVLAGPVVDRGNWLADYPRGREIGDELDAEYDMRRMPKTLARPVPGHEEMSERGHCA